MTASNNKFGPKAGLLSCMYQAIYDPGTNNQVRNDYPAVLAAYNLQPDVKDRALRVSRSNDMPTFEELLESLKGEVVDNSEDIFDRLRRTPPADPQFQKPGQGLLAFIYNALYDDTTNSRIKQSDAELDKVIEEFGLTGTPSEPLIKELVNSGTNNQDLIEAIADKLNTEMNADYSTLRQHIW